MELIDRATLDRLAKILVRIDDENEGTRQSAINAFRETCRSENIDVRDLSIAIIGSDYDLEKRWAEYKALKNQAYPDAAKSHVLIDQYRDQIERLKQDVRDAKRSTKAEDVERRAEERRELRASKPRDDKPLIRHLKNALSVIASPAYSASMDELEMRILVEESGRDYDEFCQEIGYDLEKTLTPWMRILVRCLRPAIAPKAPQRKTYKI